MGEHLLFLYLATGGGHIGAARALAAEVGRRHRQEDVRVTIADGIKEGEDFQRGLVEDGFRFTAIRYPVLWAGLYEWSRLQVVMDLQTRLMCRYSVPYFEELIPRLKPTRVILFHFLLVRPLRWAYRRLGYRLPSLTIITDPFTCHPMWFYQQCMPVACYTPQLRDYAARRYGVAPESMMVKNPIINHAYDRPMDHSKARALKSTYGLSQERDMVLIVGGGEGLPRGERYLDEMLRLNREADVVFVAGKNDELRAEAEKVALRWQGRRTAKTVVYGFVDFMSDLMNMSSVIVTKGGPASVLEAAMLEKPIMIAHYFYGQERGNVDFVVKNGLGSYTQTPRGTAEAVMSLLASPEAVRQVARHYDRVRLTNGTPEFADLLFTFDQDPPPVPRLAHG